MSSAQTRGRPDAWKRENMSHGRANVGDYTIVLATPEQVVQHSKAEFVPWSRGREFSVFYGEQVTRRRTGPWAQDDALLTWALVKRDDLNGEVYAACETYRRRAFIRGQDGVVSNGYMYGIASVVTPLAHRRNGFATHMLSLLHYVLAPPDYIPAFPSSWGAPPPALPARPAQVAPESLHPDKIPRPSSSQATSSGSFLDQKRLDYLPPGLGSILWSDVGSNFYSKCTIGTSLPGWIMEAADNTELKWDLTHSDESALDGWEILHRKDLPKVSTALSSAAREAVNEATEGTWAADPTTPGVLDFAPLRNPWSELSLRPRLDTFPIGLRRQAAGKDVIVLFATHNDAIADSLLVTCLHTVTVDTLPGLLDALDAMGRKEGRTEGIMWGLRRDNELVKAWKKLRKITSDGQRPEKDGHLLGVAWYGPSEQRGRLLDTQMWGWC